MSLHDAALRGFASDNYAGAHPEVLAALAAANGGHLSAYGQDVYTARLTQVMGRHFGRDVEVFPAFNGSGANVLALQSMLPRWGGVVCSRSRTSTPMTTAPRSGSGGSSCSPCRPPTGA